MREMDEEELEIERQLLEKHVIKKVGRKDMVKCSDTQCAMYLSLSLSKINLFVTLLGLVLVSTSDSADMM